VFIFPLYAVLIWYFAMRWRRQVRGFAVVLAGTAGCWISVEILMLFNERLDGSPYLFTHFIWGEAALILLLGTYICCLPRPPKGRHCGYCWYDLTGLSSFPDEAFVCPECGTPRDGYARSKEEGPRPRVNRTPASRETPP